MMRGDALAAWRLFTVNWIPVGLMAAALSLGLAVSGLSIKPAGAILPLVCAAAFSGIAYRIASRADRRDPMPAFVLGSAAQLVLITALMTPLTYVAATADLPLRDANLAALDRMLGLDWRGYLAFVNDWPALGRLFVLGYAMISWPMFAIPVLLGVQRHYGRLQQFTLALALTLIVTTAVSMLVPALGPYHQLGLAPSDYANITPSGGYLDELRDFFRDFPRVRDGSLRELDLLDLIGIVTFPSFHAAAAVLYLWVFWAIWWMRPAALIVNAAMLLSTPIDGGHYFVDVFAGMGVAVLAIAAAHWLGERLTVAQPAAPLPMPAAAPAMR